MPTTFENSKFGDILVDTNGNKYVYHHKKGNIHMLIPEKYAKVEKFNDNGVSVGDGTIRILTVNECINKMYGESMKEICKNKSLIYREGKCEDCYFYTNSNKQLWPGRETCARMHDCTDQTKCYHHSSQTLLNLKDIYLKSTEQANGVKLTSGNCEECFFKDNQEKNCWLRGCSRGTCFKKAKESPQWLKQLTPEQMEVFQDYAKKATKNQGKMATFNNFISNVGIKFTKGSCEKCYFHSICESKLKCPKGFHYEEK